MPAIRSTKWTFNMPILDQLHLSTLQSIECQYIVYGVHESGEVEGLVVFKESKSPYRVREDFHRLGIQHVLHGDITDHIGNINSLNETVIRGVPPASRSELGKQVSQLNRLRIDEAMISVRNGEFESIPKYLRPLVAKQVMSNCEHCSDVVKKIIMSK